MMAIAGENMGRKIFWGLITQGNNFLNIIIIICPLFFNAFWILNLLPFESGNSTFN